MKPIYINGIKTRYMITKDGNVFNKDKGKFLKLRLSRVGYYTVHLRMTALGINKLCQVHRLVAKAFIPNPLDLPQVNHKNGIKNR